MTPKQLDQLLLDDAIPGVRLSDEAREQLLNAPRMDIYSPAGTKVIFDGDGGYESEKESAKKQLVLGKTYTVKYVDIGDSSSNVYLSEAPGRGFNTVMFAQSSLLST